MSPHSRMSCSMRSCSVDGPPTRWGWGGSLVEGSGLKWLDVMIDRELGSRCLMREGEMRYCPWRMTIGGARALSAYVHGGER